MPKPSKSSASSGTRKKHAKRAAIPSTSSGNLNTKSKPSKKDIKKGLVPPPKKSYIPPSKSKPPPPQIDPLDGIEYSLPPDLVIILRRLAKKDGVTKSKALEDLEAWVRRGADEMNGPNIDPGRTEALVAMLPVWLHRFPPLCIHQSRRIRFLSVSLHISLLDIPVVRENIIVFLREAGSETQVSQILGAWCLSAWDVDRGVASRSSRSWKDALKQGEDALILGSSQPENTRFVLDDLALARYILPFVMKTIMEPSSIHATLNPSTFAASGDSTPVGTSRRGTSTPRGIPPGSNVRRSAEDFMVLSTRSEDEPESVEDRDARTRVGGMGALRWVIDTYAPTETVVAPLQPLFSSPMFWTILHHDTCPPFLTTEEHGGGSIEEPSFIVSDAINGFGTGQTIVRRAGWDLVHALFGGRDTRLKGERWRAWIRQSEDHAQRTVGLISTAVLRSAFVERDAIVKSSMWEPLLIFLTRVNNAWVLSREFEDFISSRQLQAEDEIGSDSESSTSVEELNPVALDHNVNRGSASYTEFLTFLSLGCNGSPAQGYPTVLVILSTVSRDILNSSFDDLSGFFNALWSAIDGQAFSALSTERAKGMEAFLQAWGECLVWTAGKLVKGPDTSQDSRSSPNEPGNYMINITPGEVSKVLVATQFHKLAGELGGALRMDATVAGVKVANVIEKLENLTRDLLDVAWIHIADYGRAKILSSDDENQKKYALSFLFALHRELSSDASKHGLEQLVSGIAQEAVCRCTEQIEATGALWEACAPASDGNGDGPLMRNGRVVELLLEQFGGILEHEEKFVEVLNTLLTAKLPSLISRPSLILSYLKHTADVSHRLATWQLLLSTLGSLSVLGLGKKMDILSSLLDAIYRDELGGWPMCQGKELQVLVNQVLAEALIGDSLASNLIMKLLGKPEPFIHADISRELVAKIGSTVDSHIRPLAQTSPLPESLTIVYSSLNLLLTLQRTLSIDQYPTITPVETLPWIFILAFVIPPYITSEIEAEPATLARHLWECWHARAEAQTRSIVAVEVRRLLKDLIVDTNVRPRPVGILDALQHIHSEVSAGSLAVILKPSEFETLLSFTSTDPIDSSVAVIEPLAPSFITDASRRKSSWNNNFDSYGFSPYARGVGALLHAITTDRNLARENMWALRHVLILALFANEALQLPNTYSPVFSGQHVARSELREITHLAQQVTTLLLSSAGENSWHKDVVDVLLGKPGRLDSLGEFVREVFEQAKLHNTVRDSLVLHTVLQHVLRSATKEDADMWVDLARSIEEQVLQTCLAILLAVNEFAPEPPKLDRYRNELASKLTSLPPRKANSAGLRLLRCLSAVAPSPESEVIFLPQQRAVYLAQALQAWMGSDEDLEESVESEITLVLFNLAPILQNIQGTHWEFIMDLIESNIENSSYKDGDTLVILSRTLRLLALVRDLASTNKYLRGLWNQRSKAIFELVRDLLVENTDQASFSVPRALCREQGLSIIQDLPASLMSENTLSAASMCHLLTDPSVENQKMAYQMLQRAAMKRTEHLVIEAGVDSQNATVVELPRELVALLQTRVNLDDPDNGEQDPLAHLLSWMITFDLFIDASLKVKTAYVDQLRILNLIGRYFLPSIFEILGVGNGDPFKLDQWIIDEYWLAMYDVEAPPSLQLLAAHVYYRALLTVPSLIRAWWEDLKDRQLSATITAFTSSYFSPVLIASEFVHLKPSAATTTNGSLHDETFNVKVALAVNEVTATFNVDGQQMEIGVKLPIGYPLKTVDVKPIRRFGVPEKVWRRWLFAIQQVVTSHNGRIVDGLALFKKTVSLHFEGQVECAICYSILHVVDGSLPTKPCKTCKNRFHAGCLYKWFNTSHSSSCPLCRSEIM